MNGLIPSSFNVNVTFDKDNTTTVLVMIFFLVLACGFALKIISKI